MTCIYLNDKFVNIMNCLVYFNDVLYCISLYELFLLLLFFFYFDGDGDGDGENIIINVQYEYKLVSLFFLTCGIP